MKNNKQRIFVGLELSGYLTTVIPMIKSTVVDNKKLINWVSGKNLHLTLSFIGSIDLDRIAKLKLVLDKGNMIDPKLSNLLTLSQNFRRTMSFEYHNKNNLTE